MISPDIQPQAQAFVEQLALPVIFGTYAFTRARALGKQNQNPDDPSQKLKAYNAQINEAKEKLKANEDLIDAYQELARARKQNHQHAAKQKLERLIIQKSDPEAVKKMNGKQQQAYLEGVTIQIQGWAEHQELNDLIAKRREVYTATGKGIVGHQISRVNGFVSNEIYQTAEAIGIAFALEAFRFPLIDAYQHYIAGATTLTDKGIIGIDLLGVAVGAAYLLRRAWDVRPGH